MNVRSSLRRTAGFFRRLLTNAYFWAGLIFLGLIIGLATLLVNNVAMPAYTRHDASVTVPDVLQVPADEARQLLKQHALRVGATVQQYRPGVPAEVVIDQNPPPDARVKPGRRIFLTVNSGETPMVKLPSLVGASLREARNRLIALGLQADDVRRDSIPSPYPNTVTRQNPAPGGSLPKGASVTLWYSKGLGDAYVSVPDVTNMTLEEAKATLLEQNLRSVVIGGTEEPREEEVKVVVRQSRAAGTRVREGFEIRLFLEPRGEQEEDRPDASGATPDTLSGSA